MPEIIPRPNFITKEQPLIKPVEPVGKSGMGSVLTKLDEDKSALSEKPKDPKRPNARLYEKI